MEVIGGHSRLEFFPVKKTSELQETAANQVVDGSPCYVLSVIVLQCYLESLPDAIAVQIDNPIHPLSHQEVSTKP